MIAENVSIDNSASIPSPRIADFLKRFTIIYIYVYIQAAIKGNAGNYCGTTKSIDTAPIMIEQTHNFSGFPYKVSWCDPACQVKFATKHKKFSIHFYIFRRWMGFDPISKVNLELNGWGGLQRVSERIPPFIAAWQMFRGCIETHNLFTLLVSCSL